MSDSGSDNKQTTREDLLEGFHPEEFGYATWTEMVPVFARGQMVYIDPDLDFKEVATAVESDDSATVSDWMSHGKLHNVTDAQAAEWMKEEALMFRFLIREPLVLAQPIPFASKH